MISDDEASADEDAALKKALSKLKVVYPAIEDADVLFQFCNPATMKTIVSEKTIRLSDISKMNDSMEMDWGLSILSESLEEHKEFIGHDNYKTLKDVISIIKGQTRFLISCFSKNKDILSQWRSYADDGTGFSIGFSKENLMTIMKKFGSVVYDRNVQLDIFKDKILKDSNLWRQADPAYSRRFARRIATHLLVLSCFMKNPAFAEEQEVRFVHGIIYDASKEAFRIDVPKLSSVAKPEIGFCMRGGLVSPHLDISFSNKDDFIHEIVFGPKNMNTEVDMKALLHHHGHKNVTLSRSAASYR